MKARVVKPEVVWSLVALFCVAACAESATPPPRTLPTLDTGGGGGGDLDAGGPEDTGGGGGGDDVGDPPDVRPDNNNQGCIVNAVDLPDPAGVDLDCDGMDGEVEKSVFVATYGEDTNPGTKVLPMRTINAAIQAVAADDALTFVIVEEGVYRETIELVEGVGIAGGYRFGWERTPGSYSKVLGDNPAMTGQGISEETVIVGLDIQLDRGAGQGQSAVTVSLVGSPGVVFRGVRIVGGTGGIGEPGGTGGAGANGVAGKKGANGEEDGNFPCRDGSQPAAGDGGVALACDAGPGGKGGLPGRSRDNGGSPGVTPDGGGAGGAGGAAGSNGDPGDPGDPGGTGPGGEGATNAGVFEAGVWVGDTAEPGGNGIDGTGGGGGGGGGGAGGNFGNCRSWGGAGGGGGSGGCGGQGGGAGTNGGASVAVYLENSDVFFESCKIVIGSGGQGGNGGLGGQGGMGGPGGPESNGEDGSGKGGRGGVGGRGGLGGQGGGGAGGPAFGIYSNVELSVVEAEIEFTPGQGGFGGTGGAGEQGRGEQGVTANIQIGAVE